MAPNGLGPALGEVAIAAPDTPATSSPRRRAALRSLTTLAREHGDPPPARRGPGDLARPRA
jgi:hypothetical protein